uniref:Uncharacterized protein n=1 Tax=Arundo donax TaxID=35708 RepID=A0A0A9HET0_ARUDO
MLRSSSKSIQIHFTMMQSSNFLLFSYAALSS